MNKEEIGKLMAFIKERYAQEGLDVKSCKIDSELPFEESKIKVEVQIVELKQKAIFEAQIEKIINSKDTEELEKQYFKVSEFIKLVASGQEKGLLLYGVSSLGKSYRVKKGLNQSGKKEGTDYTFITGHITPLQLYSKLFYSRDRIVVFDDVNILENKINLNMLKACLNENGGGKVEYHTSVKMPSGVPPSFLFTGQVIILLNDKPKNSEHLRAVESRVIAHHLTFTYEDIITILYDIAKQEVEGTTLEERLEVVKWIEKNTNRATKNLNIRLYQHILRFFKWDKAIWKDLSKSIIQNDEYTTLILEGMKSEDFVEQTGLSSATYKRLKNRLGLTRAYRVGR